MKFFAAGLLLVNIAFAIWYVASDTAEQPISASDPGMERLVMVNEPMNPAAQDRTQADNEKKTEESPVDEAKEETSLTTSTDTQPDEPEPQQAPPAQQQASLFPATTSRGENCYVMSLFDSYTSAQVISTELEQLGYEVRLATRYSSKVKYLVYLPAYASAAEARNITRELQEKGQQDFQILAIKGKKNSISLGVYSQPHTAAIRQKQIESMGYSPVVEPVYGTPMGYQLEFNKHDISRLTPTEKRHLTDSFKNLTILPQKCSS